MKHKRRSTKAAEVLASLMLRRRSGIAFGDCYVQVRPPAPLKQPHSRANPTSLIRCISGLPA
jgi:hypothetical protein